MTISNADADNMMEGTGNLLSPLFMSTIENRAGAVVQWLSVLLGKSEIAGENPTLALKQKVVSPHS